MIIYTSMSYKLTIKSSHYDGNNRYTIPMNNLEFKAGAKMSMEVFAMYNSTYNISGSQFGNNWVDFMWVDGVTHHWVIPDGYYSIDDLNLWLQTKFLSNKMYYVENKYNQFFVTLRTNETAYRAEIQTVFVTTQSEATRLGYTKPDGATWSYTATPRLIKLSIAPALQSYFGFVNQTDFGLVPPNDGMTYDAIDNFVYVSTIAPRVSPIFSYIVACNLVCNPYTNYSGIIGSVPIDKSFGELVQYHDQSGRMIDVQPGTYNKIEITLWDQNENPLQFNDRDLTCILAFQM